MKNINLIKIIIVFALAVTVLNGCNDDFLREKRDFKKTTDVLYQSYIGARLRVDNIYTLCLPASNVGISYDYPSSGISDAFSQSTEEFGGLSSFVGENPMTNSSIDLFYNEAKTSRSPWGRIRNCNDVIENLENPEICPLKQEEKEELLGQVYFFRAWVYYRMVINLGGVPIVDKVQNPLADPDNLVNLIIPRATTKECVEFICKDLDKAAEFLPYSWNSQNWGRVTAGTALALKARLLLWYASPLFNRTDKADRWEAAYEASKAAIEALQQGGFGLAYLDNPGINATGWAKMFAETKNPEAVFVTLYNNVIDEGGSSNPYKNNGWENGIRPSNAMGGGGRTTTSQMVDLFPMADGRPALDKDWNPINGYDPDAFFVNRDPRFYRTFAFPGVRWAFKGDPTHPDKPTYIYKGTDYTLWNYAWYKDASKRDSVDMKGLYINSGYAADGFGSGYRGIYIRKKSDDLDVNTTPLYVEYKNTSGELYNIFRSSAAPHMEIRYAEVLLNFAEAACGANKGAEALEALRLIRKRVGYTGDCGLDESLASDRGRLFAAIIYERQVELAFEGKRFDDMRRWLLWDGGINFNQVANAPGHWTLTGFGGNTCTYLDVSPLNGKIRTGMEIAISMNGPNAGIGEDGVPQGQTLHDIDPFNKAGIARPDALDYRQELEPQITALRTFYNANFVRKAKRVDGGNTYPVINYLPNYYFIGLNSSAQRNNSKLAQTIGWQDVMTGVVGIYDPLAE